MSVCLSRCSFKLILLFLFLDGVEPFLAVISPCGTPQNIVLRFWFRPPNAQNLLPKICTCTKSPITRLVWHTYRRCLGLLGGFREWPIQWNHVKYCGPTGVTMSMKFGLCAEIYLVAYRLVYVSLCISVNTITPEPLEISSRNFQSVILWPKKSKGGSSKMARVHWWRFNVSDVLLSLIGYIRNFKHICLWDIENFFFC